MAQAKSNKTAAPAKPHHKVPRMKFVVTATRMEQPLDTVGTTVSVVGAHQIQEQQIHASSDALRQVPGVEVNQSGSAGNQTDVSIRGSSAAETLILVDGIDVNSGATGGFDISSLTSDDLERIEVVRGAGGALYGSSAIGGVVNFITREGSGPLKLSYDGEGGNRATQRQALVFDGADGRLAYSGALSYFSTTAFRLRNASFDDLSAVSRLDYHLTPDTKFTGFARYIRSNVSLVNFSNFLTPVDPNAHQRNEFMLYNGVVTHQFSDRIEGRMSVFFVRNDLRINDTPFPGNLSFERDRVPDETRGTNIELHYEWSKGFRSLAGFDFKDRWVRSA
ncbi:MAG: TonB-dependent receptor, partial [Candidatus Binataceae bacterium]